MVIGEPMDPDRYSRVKALVERARELAQEERASLLDTECGDDPLLRQEVESLVAAGEDAESWLEMKAERPVRDDRMEDSMSELAAGRNLSHYQILEKIGQGAMGVVWKAEDKVLGRAVAIKVLIPEAAGNQERQKMFLEEAKLASSVSQANIVQVHEFGHEDGLDFIVMEYVEGQPLSSKIRNRPLEPEFTADIGKQVARALSKAHRKGLLHRDLKPSNILVTNDGEVKVVDFGLATLFSEHDVSTASLSVLSQAETQTVERSRTGKRGKRQIVGTLPYMSPEQVRGGKLDARSDIFSLGSILYEMTSGQRPFPGHNSAEVASEIRKARPRPVHEMVPKVPIELERIIQKSLSAKPSERYQTMEDLAVDLLRLEKDLESGSSPSYEETVGVSGSVDTTTWNPRTWSRPSKILGVLSTLAVTVALSGWIIQTLDAPVGESSDAGHSVDASLIGRVRQLTFSGNALAPVWSPDGRTISFTTWGGGDTGIHVMPVEGGTPRALDGLMRGATAWNWAPDGRGLVVHGRHPEQGVVAVFLVDMFGTPPKLLAEQAYFADLHRDGRRLAYAHRSSGEQGIWVKDLQTGETRPVIRNHGEGTAAYKAQWSPIDDRIAYHRWEGFGHELWLYDPVDGSDREVETGPIEASGHFDWTPDGKALVVGGELGGIYSIWKFPLNGDRPVRLTPGSEEERHTSVAPDGRGVVFTRSRDISRLVTVDTATGESDEPVSLTVAAKNAVFSPDGESLVFQALINGEWEVWSAPLEGDGSPHAIVKKDGFSSFGPVLGESGEVLHIRSDLRPATIFGKIGWSQTLWASDEEGGMQQQVVAAGDRVSRLSPTPKRSSRLLYTVHGETSGEILKILDADGSSRVLMTESEDESVHFFDWGPGDDEVLVKIRSPERPRLLKLNITSNERTEIFSRGSVSLGDEDGRIHSVGVIALSPERTRLAIVAKGDQSEHFGLYILDLGTLTFERLRYFEGLVHPDFVTWSPDGTKLVMDLHKSQSDIFVLENLGEMLGGSL